MLGRHAFVALLALLSCTEAKKKKSAPPPPPKAVNSNKNGPAVSLRAGTEKTVPLRTHSLYAREPRFRDSVSSTAT